MPMETVAEYCQKILNELKDQKFNKNEMELLLKFFKNLVTTTENVIKRGEK